jgi:prepilin-type N-terminal cleavage/methylation domain-containing protein
MAMSMTVPGNDERGLTLAEMLVAMVLLAIVGSILTAAVVQIYRSSRVQTQDYDTLGALRNAIGFMERELREGRRLRPSSTSQNLSIWVDHNRDFFEDDEEVVTYLISDEDGNGTYELRRTTQAGTSQILARYLHSDSHFEYLEDTIDLGYNNPSLAGTSVIVIELTADSPGTEGPARNFQTQVRLRNVPLD